MSAGVDNTCALREDDAAVCWGDNKHGQLEAPDGSFVAINAGNGLTCGLRAYGGVICWGKLYRP